MQTIPGTPHHMVQGPKASPMSDLPINNILPVPVRNRSFWGRGVTETAWSVIAPLPQPTPIRCSCRVKSLSRLLCPLVRCRADRTSAKSGPRPDFSCSRHRQASAPTGAGTEAGFGRHEPGGQRQVLAGVFGRGPSDPMQDIFRNAGFGRKDPLRICPAWTTRMAWQQRLTVRIWPTHGCPLRSDCCRLAVVRRTRVARL